VALRRSLSPVFPTKCFVDLGRFILALGSQHVSTTGNLPSTTSASSAAASAVQTVTTDSKVAAGPDASSTQMQAVQSAIPGPQLLAVPTNLNPSGSVIGQFPNHPPPGQPVPGLGAQLQPAGVGHMGQMTPQPSHTPPTASSSATQPLANATATAGVVQVISAYTVMKCVECFT
jgi:hypothetical protein